MQTLKNLISKYIISIILVLSLILVGSSKGYPTQQYSYHPLEFFNDGFEVDSLEEGNIDSVLLKRAVDQMGWCKSSW